MNNIGSKKFKFFATTFLALSYLLCYGFIALQEVNEIGYNGEIYGWTFPLKVIATLSLPMLLGFLVGKEWTLLKHWTNSVTIWSRIKLAREILTQNAIKFNKSHYSCQEVSKLTSAVFSAKKLLFDVLQDGIKWNYDKNYDKLPYSESINAFNQEKNKERQSLWNFSLKLTGLVLFSIGLGIGLSIPAIWGTVIFTGLYLLLMASSLTPIENSSSLTPKENSGSLTPKENSENSWD